METALGDGGGETVLLPDPDGGVVAWDGWAGEFITDYCVSCHSPSASCFASGCHTPGDPRTPDFRQKAYIVADSPMIRCGIAVTQQPAWTVERRRRSRSPCRTPATRSPPTSSAASWSDRSTRGARRRAQHRLRDAGGPDSFRRMIRPLLAGILACFLLSGCVIPLTPAELDRNENHSSPGRSRAQVYRATATALHRSGTRSRSPTTGPAGSRRHRSSSRRRPRERLRSRRDGELGGVEHRRHVGVRRRSAAGRASRVQRRTGRPPTRSTGCT